LNGRAQQRKEHVLIARRAVALAQPPSEWALRELPARVAIFLRAVGTHPPLRVALKAGGYGASDHAEGLRLFAAACPYLDDAFDPTADRTARDAAAELEAWAKKHLMRLRTAMERLHPDVVALFPDRLPEGAHVLLVVSTLLERLAQLETEPNGAHVLDTLRRRGFDDELRRHLAELVRNAKHAEPPPSPSRERTEDATVPDPALVALHRWYDDWAGTARAIVGRRDWLIRMGLADRRRPDS
jgi:hypothetical protein